MIDRFDPAALESELKSHSALDALFAGGRRAKLWELYENRYREIAKSASTRFLGEIGSDFRDGYEEREDN
jgi:type VI secretion system protein ImpI